MKEYYKKIKKQKKILNPYEFTIEKKTTIISFD